MQVPAQFQKCANKANLTTFQIVECFEVKGLAIKATFPVKIVLLSCEHNLALLSHMLNTHTHIYLVLAKHIRQTSISTQSLNANTTTIVQTK